MQIPGRPYVLCCLSAVWLWLPVPGWAQGSEIAGEVCSACHGVRGVSLNPLVPTLAGQPYTLIEDNLLAFRQGKRSCAESRADGSPAAALAATMCSHVESLGDETIAQLAEFYASLEFSPASQPFDPGLAARGSNLHVQLGCDRCHANGGRETLGMAPRLAGQWTPFLRRALEAVRNGARKGPKMMNPQIRALSDEELEWLLNYYASNGQAGRPH
jgi:sulfide dehydrogenase cytochrome subunit